MSRLARVVVPGLPHHVTQRGVRRLQVFAGPGDYQLYLGLLKEYGEKYGTKVWAYCLMPNHVHLVAVPESASSLASTLQRTHAAFAELQNRKSGWTGHLWQQRFHSTPMDEPHTYAALRYVLRNPVRAGWVQRAEEWPWSSAAAHAGRSPDPLVPAPGTVAALDALAAEPLLDGSEPEIERLRRATRTGRPLGDERFLLELEQRLGRQLLPRTGGRPRRPQHVKLPVPPRVAPSATSEP